MCLASVWNKAISLKWQPTWSSKSLKVDLTFARSFLATQMKKKLLLISLTSLGVCTSESLAPNSSADTAICWKPEPKMSHANGLRRDHLEKSIPKCTLLGDWIPQVIRERADKTSVVTRNNSAS